MDYWAGSLPGSRKCECGLLGVCFDPDKWCNCDSGHDDWLWDGGEITQKEYLPVRALHFGDTGNPLDRKEGRFSLGPLEWFVSSTRLSCGITSQMKWKKKNAFFHFEAQKVLFQNMS